MKPRSNHTQLLKRYVRLVREFPVWCRLLGKINTFIIKETVIGAYSGFIGGLLLLAMIFMSSKRLLYS